MKKFNEEKNSMFIQREDLKIILDFNEKDIIDIPEEFKEIFRKDIEGMNLFSSHEFVEYTLQELVEFLKKQEWIVDYEFTKLSLMEYELQMALLERKIEDLLEIDNQYNLEYKKAGANQKEICEKEWILYKELIPLMYKSHYLSSEHFLRILDNQIELDIPNGLIIR